MTTDDILSMAREAWEQTGEGWVDKKWFDGKVASFERFAALVAAAEREQCAKVCKDEMIDEEQCNDDVAYNAGCHDCAAAIRARGKT